MQKKPKRPQINLVASQELFDAIEEIRAKTRPIPSISDAVRDSIFGWRDSLRRKAERNGTGGQSLS